MVKGGAGYLLATSLLALASPARAGETTTYTYDSHGRLKATTGTLDLNVVQGWCP